MDYKNCENNKKINRRTKKTEKVIITSNIEKA